MKKSIKITNTFTTKSLKTVIAASWQPVKTIRWMLRATGVTNPACVTKPTGMTRITRFPKAIYLVSLLLAFTLAFTACGAPAPQDNTRNQAATTAAANIAATTAAATTAASIRGTNPPATQSRATAETAETDASATTAAANNSSQANRDSDTSDGRRYILPGEGNAPGITVFPGAPQRIPFVDEEYLAFDENIEKNVAEEPFLTFSLKVDTASYTNVARYINSGNLPPADAVRIEEMINYFSYDEPLPENDTPFSIYAEVGPSPFDAAKEIAYVRVKSRDIDRSQLPSSNLTFLIDTSGSMNSYDKMPLLKSSFAMLVENLDANDTISVVTYAGNAKVALDSVRGDQKGLILDAIYGLEARGSTAGANGISTAYALAEKNYREGANNRVILATDGDFNVGVSSVRELEQLISKKRESGVYLTILGFGTENLKDNKMETLAKNGNGNYSYIDSMATANKVLVEELGTNLFVIADDVKAQIEFNPAKVQSYRLIGYENRMLATRDFEDDKKDAGEIGIGTDVVLLFEITPASATRVRYQQPSINTAAVSSLESWEYYDELFEVRIRYKDPGMSVSKLITAPVKQVDYPGYNTSDFNFAVSVAGFGHLLKNSPYKGDITAEHVMAYARDSLGSDTGGYRSNYIALLNKYMQLA